MPEFDCRQKSILTTTKTNTPIHATVTSKAATLRAISSSRRIYKHERPTPLEVFVRELTAAGVPFRRRVATPERRLQRPPGGSAYTGSARSNPDRRRLR